MKLRVVCGASSTASSNSIVPRAVSMKACGDSIRRDQLRIVVRARSGRPAPAGSPLARRSPARSLPRSSAARTRIAQSLSASAVLIVAVASAGPYAARACRIAPRADVGGVGLRRRVRLAQRRRPIRRLERAEAFGSRRAHDEVRVLQPLDQHAADASGAWSLTSGAEDGADHALVGVLQHARARDRERPRGSSAPRTSASAARTRQSRSGSIPDSTKVKDSGSIAAAARSAAARMAGQSSVSRSCATAQAVARLSWRRAP